MTPRRTTSHATMKPGLKKPLLLILSLLVVVLMLVVLLKPNGTDSPLSTTHTPSSNTTKSTSKTFNKSAYSLTDPSSMWVVVNKQHPLVPADYAPTLTVPNVPLKGSKSSSNMQVATTMASSLETMFTAASTDGYHLKLSSGYRSYGYQVGVYNRIVASQGQTSADEQSARPGYSEHQTGLAADIEPISGKCDLSQCFGQTPEGQWVASNAYKYGFIIRYQADKQAVTGYEFEPWHLRYVGVELSTEMRAKGITTLEEFFEVSGGSTYN